jgi:hypothetical protein
MIRTVFVALLAVAAVALSQVVVIENVSVLPMDRDRVLAGQTVIIRAVGSSTFRFLPRERPRILQAMRPWRWLVNELTPQQN